MFPSAASAVTPTRFEVDETVEVDYPCDLIEVAEIHRSFTTFYDQDGNVVRILEQITFEGVITNTSTGETFVDSGHNTAMFLPDFATGFTLTGIIYNIREPREGLLFLDAGRLVVNAAFDPVFQSNMALSLSDGDTALCEALG